MLRIPISPSLLLATALVLVHGAACACLLGFVPGWGWTSAGLIAVAASLVFHLWRDALGLARDAVAEISLDEDGNCDLLTLAAGELRGRVMASTFVSVFLIAVNVRLDSGRTRTVILLPDTASAENRRKLRVWLRHALRLQQPGSAGL